MTENLTLAELEMLEKEVAEDRSLAAQEGWRNDGTTFPDDVADKLLAAARREVERRELPADLKAQHWEQIPCAACDGRGWHRGQGYGVKWNDRNSATDGSKLP